MHLRKALIILLSLVFIRGASAPENTAKDNTDGYRLLIYYGIPEGVNGLWDQAKAATLFAEYDFIVFGEGLEKQAHSFHDSTSKVIAAIREPKLLRRCEPSHGKLALLSL